MLTAKPIFTWRIETQGARYEGKINGVLLEKDAKGNMLQFEQPVNQYMQTGKNRIALYLYPKKVEGFGPAKISVSLYVNQDEAPESDKKLIGQIIFNAADLISGNGIQSSMPTMRLNSMKEFKQDKNGDVVVFSPIIEPSNVRPNALYLYQDIELITPFPEWGFLKADHIEFPEKFSDYKNNIENYRQKLLKPLYDVHINLFEAMKTQNMDKILPLFSERNREYDIAFYLPEGSYEKKLREALISDFSDPKKIFKMQPFSSAKPTVSDDRALIKLGAKSLIYFVDKNESAWNYYPIWFYQKNGKWIISR